MAHGIFPAILEGSGLAPALWTLADEAAVPVELSEVPEERLPASVERAAYLVVSGAIDRAAAASGPGDPARRLDARLRLRAGHLDVDVAGPPAGGYVHVADRVGVLGGRLTSTPDGLHAEIPCPRRGETVWVPESRTSRLSWGLVGQRLPGMIGLWPCDWST